MMMQPSTDSLTACWSEAQQVPIPIAEKASKMVNNKRDLEAVKPIPLIDHRYNGFDIRAFVFWFIQIHKMESLLQTSLNQRKGILESWNVKKTRANDAISEKIPKFAVKSRNKFH